MHTDANATIDTSKHKPLLDNVRLWDWKPFHDTVTQMQALRPYYAFHEPPDVDRYTIDGQYRQVLLSSRELDITSVAGNAIQLDQPALHLHARLRPRAGRSQQDHPRRTTGLSGAGHAARWSRRPR